MLLSSQSLLLRKKDALASVAIVVRPHTQIAVQIYSSTCFRATSNHIGAMTIACSAGFVVISHLQIAH